VVHQPSCRAWGEYIFWPLKLFVQKLEYIADDAEAVDSVKRTLYKLQFQGVILAL